MSYGDVSSENDIRARAAALAETLMMSSSHPEVYRKARDEFKDELSHVRLPADDMTWFALERVALRAGAKPIRVKVDSEGNVNNAIQIPAGALVLINHDVPPPEQSNSLVRALRSAGLTVAPPSWTQVLRSAGVSNTCIDNETDNSHDNLSTVKIGGRTISGF